MEPIIKTKELNVIFSLGKSNEYHALRKINIEIFPQEYIVLFGPSGCGKSTLLYSMLGILAPTSGDMIIKGDSVYKYTPAQLVNFQRKVIGIIYQAFYLIPSISILDNVSLPLIFSNVSAREREARAMNLLERFGVDQQANKLPSALSGGQMQRVAVARSLATDPKILLADEPVGNLDSKSTKAVMDTLNEINEVDQKTIILVTHDAQHLKYAHRIYYMRDGNVEREVANPQKTQIKKAGKGKMVFTEIDRLSRQFPYSSPDDLRIKSVVNYLTQNLNLDQIDRLEKSLKLVIDGRIEIETFVKILTTAFDKGGVGITKSMAENFSQKMEKIIKESRDIARFRRSVINDEEGENGDRQKKMIKRLRVNLLDQYDGDVNIAQVRRLEKALEERVMGDTNGVDFRNFLNLSIDKGGAGFGYKTSKILSNYLEKLLAQGVTE